MNRADIFHKKHSVSRQKNQQLIQVLYLMVVVLMITSCGVKKNSTEENAEVKNTVSILNYPYIEKFHEGLRFKSKGEVDNAIAAFTYCLTVRQDDDAVFYALSALLLNENLQFSKHSGVISATHQKFIKSGRLDKKVGEDLTWLFEMRGVGDYGVTLHVTLEEAENSLRCAKRIVEKVKKLLL